MADTGNLLRSAVCLVIPPSSFLIDERVFPSLGILKVGAALEQMGVPVIVIDLSGESSFAKLFDYFVINTFRATAYGITATMPQMPQAAKIAQFIRSAHPSARLILGGPHPTLMLASARAERKRGVEGRACKAMAELHAIFDVVVAGDGEKAIFEALKPNAPPLVDADNPKSTLFLVKQDLLDAPLPARHLINIASYRYEIEGYKTQSLIGQLGCPMGCAFCGGRSSPFLRRVRLRDSMQVIAEMRHLYETWGTRGFMFLDDELNVNRSFMELLDRMIEMQEEVGVDFRMRGLLKSELVTEPMVKKMYAAGFRQVLIGFESGDDRILLNMKKNATKDENTRCVEMVKAAGIKVKALMSLGHAGESLESISATQEWLLQVQPSDFDVTIITVYPGTPYYDEAVELTPGIWTYTAKNGDRLHAYPVDHLTDVNFYKGMPGEYQSFVFTDYLTREQLVASRDAVETTVRELLQIPWPSLPAELLYEHSMAMGLGGR